MQKIHKQRMQQAIILLSKCNKKIRAMASRRNEKPVQQKEKEKNQKRDDEKTMQNQAIRGWGFEGVCATTPNCHLERAKLGVARSKLCKMSAHCTYICKKGADEED